MQATDSYLFSLQKEYLTFETLLKKGKLFNNPLQYIFQNEAVIHRIKNPYLVFLIRGDKMFFHAENTCSAQRKVFPLSSFSKHTLQNHKLKQQKLLFTRGLERKRREISRV